MELASKLRELRNQKGITQQELADILHVTRSAVSKWESGRGCPNIESLKDVATYYGVSVDLLLKREDEGRSIEPAEQRTKLNKNRLSITNLCAAALLVLPIFGEKSDSTVHSLPLFVCNIPDYLKIVYCTFISAALLWGILGFSLKKSSLQKLKYVSDATHLALLMIFTMSRQPYAATFSLVLLTAAVLITNKTPWKRKVS